MNNDTPTSMLVVDLSTNTGPVKHGASGFLYGLGNDGIPSPNMLAPLTPQVAAQKPEGGLQHPNGDAINVSEMYRAAGGKEIEIYIQDIYPNWPYDHVGMEDYLDKVEQVVRQVLAVPHPEIFSYVPFNEPDQIWYNKTDKRQALLNDWNIVYWKIKSLDPAARIVGPNFASYDSGFYRDFMAFASENHCLPDVVSWHELNQNFFPGWYERYEDFRSIERSLNLAPREICINEYCRIKGDLAIPGQLVQWITRFENSKVDACLAYWTTAGCLNDLVTQDHDNQATGGWWLYKWYAGLTGHTVRVTPPDANAEGLQGVASFDEEKKQARILFGGSYGSIDLIVKGLENIPYLEDSAHVTLWETAYTGLKSSQGPIVILEGNYPIIDGEIHIHLTDLVETSAYQVILTPQTAACADNHPNRYLAEFADLSGSAGIVYGDAQSPVPAWVEEVRGSKDPADEIATTFVVTAGQNGFYDITLRYSAGPREALPAAQSLKVMLNGSGLIDLPLSQTPGWDQWADARIRVFLTAGINRIAFHAFPGNGGGAVRIGWIEAVQANGPIQCYEAEAAENTVSGAAAVLEDPAASGGKYVGHIGSGPENALQFNQIQAPNSGLHRMVVTYANAEFRGGHSYNSQVVDRFAEISVNGRQPQKVYFRNTFAWDHYQTRVVDVDLQAGNNTIRFFNSASSANAPHIDKIEIAPLLAD